MSRLIFALAISIVIWSPSGAQNNAAETPVEPTPVLPEGFVLDPVWPEKGSTVTGEAIAWDGDTIEIAGQAIRLFGIDAPEMAGDARGPVARGALDDILAPNRTVTCEALDIDRHKRPVARCRAGGRDIAEAMVLAGRAFSFRKYSTDYDAAEAEARAAGRGFWGSPTGARDYWLIEWGNALAAPAASLAAIFGVAIGFGVYFVRRRHEKQDLAAALMGEITSLLRIVQIRRYIDTFQKLKAKAEAAEPWNGGAEYETTQDYLEVFSKNVTRLGMLPGDLPERTALMYTLAKAVMEDFGMLRSGGLDDLNNQTRAYVFDQMIVLLETALNLGIELTADLAKAAGRPKPQFYLPIPDAAEVEAPAEKPAPGSD